MKLSVVIITKNSEDILGQCLQSIEGLWSELLVADDYSTDSTPQIIKNFGGKLLHLPELNLGQRKRRLVQIAKFDWVLVLDSDEYVSPELYKEIKAILSRIKVKEVGYSVPYQNYVFGEPVHYGGERYSKVRLFRKNYGTISTVPVHEEIEIEGELGKVRGVLYHYSYRNPWQLFSKFTRYSIVISLEKYNKKESITMQKLFLYGLHMFWARLIEDSGWKDGWRGLILAFAFGYLESLTYWLLLLRHIIKHEA